MATVRANPGDIVDLKTWADDQPKARTKAIVKAEQFEVIRLTLQPGKEIPNHKVGGPIIVHCIQGKVNFTAMGITQELEQGRLLHLLPGEPHSLQANEHAVVLLTIMFN